MEMEMERKQEADLQNDQIVSVKSSDGQIFEVPETVALQSGIIKKFIDVVGTENPIPLPCVSSHILEKIIKYCTYHVHHTTQGVVDPWDVEFVNVDRSTLFQLAQAAHYLDITTLLDLVCQTIADAIAACETVEEMRELLNIQNDLTPQEEQEMRREVQWGFKVTYFLIANYYSVRYYKRPRAPSFSSGCLLYMIYSQ